MRPFKVRAPDDLARDVVHEARRQGVSEAQLWRQAMQLYLADVDRRRIDLLERRYEQLDARLKRLEEPSTD